MTAGSLPRAIALLRILAATGSDGASISYLIEASKLPRATVYRVLGALADAGWVERRADDRYYFGAELASLSTAAAAAQPVAGLLRSDLSDLRDALGQTVYLSVPIGLDTLCVARLETQELVKMLVLTVGSRQPLGLGAGGLAILAAEDPEVASGVIDANIDRYLTRPAFDAKVFQQALTSARKEGHARHTGLFTPGVGGIGVALHNRMGSCVGAVSTAYLLAGKRAEDFDPVADKMKRAARVMEKRL